MSREATLGPESIRDQFHELAEGLDEPTTVYLIGGGALTLSSIRNATRDIDFIVESSVVSDALLRALSSAGYDPLDDPEDEYDDLDAAFIVQQGPRRFDVFNRQVVVRLTNRPLGERPSTTSIPFTTIDPRDASLAQNGLTDPRRGEHRGTVQAISRRRYKASKPTKGPPRGLFSRPNPCLQCGLTTR